MKVSLRAKIKDEKQRNDFYEVLKLICDQEKLQLEERGECVVVEICPQGVIECREDEGSIRMETHTSHAGPGFHAYCVNLMEWIDEECEAECAVSDDCGYREQPDFQHLKYDIFYPWLQDLKRLLLEEESMQRKNYYFDSSHYLPASHSDRIITPCGFLDRHEFEEMDIEQLAPYFFVWINEQRDAQYYKNCALHLLAKEGYGGFARMNEVSEKFASMIADYIEIAHQKDPSITLPLHAYHELCRLLGREEAVSEGVEMDEEISQYRHQEVYHLFHEWSLYALGCCERSYDPVHDELYLMAPYVDAGDGWEWMWKASCHSLEAASWAEVEENGTHWQNETVKGIDLLTEQDDFYQLRSLLSCDQQRLYLELIIKEEKDIAYLRSCVHQCQCNLHL